MRKLATIQKIKALEPIQNADAIEKATVLGWQLVTKKGEFNVGDWCVYCEIDSLLPDKPAFEFLKPRGMRIRTVRLRDKSRRASVFRWTSCRPAYPWRKAGTLPTPSAFKSTSRPFRLP
jgi:RNA ligase (TIGR02306 family)